MLIHLHTNEHEINFTLGLNEGMAMMMFGIRLNDRFNPPKKTKQNILPTPKFCCHYLVVSKSWNCQMHEHIRRLK